MQFNVVQYKVVHDATHDLYGVDLGDRDGNDKERPSRILPGEDLIMFIDDSIHDEVQFPHDMTGAGTGETEVEKPRTGGASGKASQLGESEEGKETNTTERVGQERPSRNLPDNFCTVPTRSLTSTDCSGTSIPVAKIPAGCTSATCEGEEAWKDVRERSGGCGPHDYPISSYALPLGGDIAAEPSFKGTHQHPSGTLLRFEYAAATFNRPGNRSTGDLRDLPGGHSTVPQGECSKKESTRVSDEVREVRSLSHQRNGSVGGIIGDSDSNVVEFYKLLGLEAPTISQISVSLSCADTSENYLVPTAAGTDGAFTDFAYLVSTTAAGTDGAFTDLDARPSAIVTGLNYLADSDLGPRALHVTGTTIASDSAGPSAVVSGRVIDVEPSAVATTTTTTDDNFASLRCLFTDFAAQASLGRCPPTPLMRQDEPKLAEFGVDPNLDECDAIGDARAGPARKGENIEQISGLIGIGKWRKLKGGVTMDSGCSTQCRLVMRPMSEGGRSLQTERIERLTLRMGRGSRSTV